MCRSPITKIKSVLIPYQPRCLEFSDPLKEYTSVFSCTRPIVPGDQNLKPPTGKRTFSLVNNFLTVQSLLSVHPFRTPLTASASLSNRHAFIFTFHRAQVAARQAFGVAAAEAAATSRAPGARDVSAAACCTRFSCGCARRTSRISWRCSRFCSRCARRRHRAHPFSPRSSSSAPSPPSSVCAYLVVHSMVTFESGRKTPLEKILLKDLSALPVK